MKEIGSPHLDINSFPIVNPALTAELKVARCLEMKKKPEETSFKLSALASDSIWSFSHHL